MRLLLDTSTLIFWVHDVKRLGPTTHEALADSRNTVFVSAANAWEIGIKRAIGKLIATGEVHDWIAEARFEELPISVEHATGAGGLPLHHSDPFDRMLVAQAQLESLTLVSQDEEFRRYDVALLDARI